MIYVYIALIAAWTALAVAAGNKASHFRGINEDAAKGWRAATISSAIIALLDVITLVGLVRG